MWLICRPRCNVLPTFVLPCLCIFGSTPTPRCPCRVSSADTLFQPKTGHVLLSLVNFLSPHCLRWWETLAGATGSAVASKCDRHLCIAPPAAAPNPAGAVSYVVCRLRFLAPRTSSKLINTLQEHPARFETTSCCQVEDADLPSGKPQSHTQTSAAAMRSGKAKFQTTCNCNFSEAATNLPLMTHRTSLLKILTRSVYFPSLTLSAQQMEMSVGVEIPPSLW